MKTILITDAGGRGAALVDKYGQSKYVGKILVVPGNDLMQINTQKLVTTFPNLKTTSVTEILDICKREKVDLVNVAQDNAVESGLVDELIKNGVAVMGPTRLAGQIEWDKAWARDFMKKYSIPSPKYYIFNSEQEGLDFVKQNPHDKWFIKASGLAEGKGVIPGGSLDETTAAIKQMSKFGSSGETYLLEEWLIGEEFSAFAFCDGENFVYLGSAQDHKRVNDGDSGPNTGGMGCVSNPLVIDEEIKKQVKKIFEKAVKGLREEGRPYKGVLYLGGMVIKDQVYIIEFNARWGDPEAEVLLPSIKTDLYEIDQAIIRGRIKDLNLEVDKKVRVVVALVAKGYPENYAAARGKKIFGIDEVVKSGISKASLRVKVYGAGIKKVDGDYLVNGGRVLYLMAEGEDIVKAREKVYSAISKIKFEGDNLHYRKDIGWRDLERLKS